MFKKALVAAAVIAAMGAGTAAQAATLNYNGDLFSATVTEDTASATSFDYLLTMTMQFSGNSATDEFYGDIIESWSLQLPSAAAVSLVSVNGGSTAGWAWNSTGKADATGCGSGNVNSICVDWGSLGSAEGGSGLTITDPYTATFVARLIFGSASTWDGSGTNFHLLTVRQTTNGCGKDDPSPCWKKDGGLISQNLTNEVPVPGTLGLLGLGLAGLGMVRRKQQA